MSRQNTTKQGSYTNPAFCQQSEFFDARCKSPQRRQSPVGAHTVHILDTSIRSIQEEPLPPRPSYVEECDEEQEFYEEMIVDDHGAIQEKKFVVLHQQHQQATSSQGRYDYIPLQRQQTLNQSFSSVRSGTSSHGSIRTQQRPQLREPQREVRTRVASPPKVLYHEEVDASTGTLHRYATIPTDDELDEDEPIDEECEEAHELEEHEIPPSLQPQIRQKFALVPVAEIKNKSRYAVITEEDIANASRPVVISPRPSPMRPMVQKPQMRAPPNPVATQKLHELLTTPKKKLTMPITSPMSPLSPIHPIRGSMRQTNTPPPKAQQKLNYAIGARNMSTPQAVDKRHTAIVAPICSSPKQQAVYHETTFSDKPEKEEGVGKYNTAQKTIAVAAFMMILCGAVTTGLSIYMISYLGRNYYLDFGVLAGSICFLLGLLGFRSRHVYWLPNRNYISGYFVLSVFSLLTCCGLLVLLVTQPKPGTLLADMTSGAVCGISGLSLGLAAIGLLASYCCNVPPPDNRVQHCAPGFTV